MCKVLSGYLKKNHNASTYPESSLFLHYITNCASDFYTCKTIYLYIGFSHTFRSLHLDKHILCTYRKFGVCACVCGWRSVFNTKDASKLTHSF